MSAPDSVQKPDVKKPRRGRRRFLLGALSVTGALIVGWGVLPPRSRTGAAADFPAAAGEIALNGWIKIGRDGKVIVAVPRVEMGQGIYTAFAMLVAEELGVPLANVRAESVSDERIYGNVAGMVESLPIHPDDNGKAWVRATHWLLAKSARELGLIMTGGSSSVADAWQPLREAAASARMVLIEAAARRWQVDPATVSIQDGVVIGAGAGDRRMPLEQVVADAARIQAPSTVKLKPASAYTVLGRPAPRLDVQAKTDGSAVFAIDVRPPDLCYAAVSLCPVMGAKVEKYDEAAARAKPGVLEVVRFDGAFGGADGIAVVATHYWQALQALGSLAPVWSRSPHDGLDSAKIESLLAAELDSERSGISYRSYGDGLGAFEKAGNATLVEAEYHVPYLAHATMEPMNCTAQVRAGQVQLWAPTQVATLARMAAARAAGVAGSQVKIDVPLLGGGFGRRLESDFVAQAVSIAMHTKGRPVQVIWSRQDDIRHDFYRPQVRARLRARIDGNKLRALASRSAGQSILGQELTRIFGFAGAGLDRYTAEGLFDMPYEIAHQHVAHLNVDLPVPIGFWRSVGHSYNAFFLECFVDEVAAAMKRDPLELRRELLQRHPRHLQVLDAAVRAAGINALNQVPSGAGKRAYGIAFHACFGSIAAQVAEVSLENGRPRVHRIVCAIDCGQVVNPQIIRQQVESGVIFGLGAALYGKITIEKGGILETNFTDFQILTMAETPQIETVIVASTEAPTGVGEVAVPPVAPAVANAVFRLTGKPVRRLPISI